MASDTVEIKVELVTKHAKRALQRLRGARKQTRETARTRIAQATKRRAKQIAGAVGGYAAVHRVTRKMRGGDAQVDPWKGAIVPIIARVQQEVDESVGFSSAARRQARSDVVAQLSGNVGAGASVTQAKEVFEIQDRIRQKEQRGLYVLRQTIKGPSLDELMLAAVKGFFTLSKRAWAYVWDSIFE